MRGGEEGEREGRKEGKRREAKGRHCERFGISTYLITRMDKCREVL